MAPFGEILPQLRGEIVLLFNWGVDDNVASEIAAVLRENKSLNALNLGGNQIGDQGVMALFPALLEAERLTRLHLHRNRLCDGAATILAEAAKANTSIRELYLGDNHIGDIGAEALAGALLQSSGLVKLQLPSNNISDRGAEALAEALVKNHVLSDLDLGHNKLSNAGVTRLQNAEMGHPSLRRLVLVGNSLVAKEEEEPTPDPVIVLGTGEYLVEVDTSEERFGIHLKIDKLNRTLKISSIDDGGLIARWGEEHADDAVAVGDQVIQVNGCRAIDAILAECRKSQAQRVVFQRAASILMPNSRIQLVDHRDRPQDKGKLGKTMQWYGSMMRWKVRLDDGTVLMCRSTDLSPCDVAMPVEFAVGELVHSDTLGAKGVVCTTQPAGSPQMVRVAFFNLGTLEVSRDTLQSGLTEDGANVDEFYVFLEKGRGAKLGLDVAALQDGSLQVTAVGRGLVQDWNNLSSCTSSVRVGDRMMQVNSAFGNSDSLLEECRKKSSLMIRFRRANSDSTPCTIHQ